ncbi:MAG: hypothetical protein AAFX39_03565, partial [Pseudomonadota bacterium]
RYVAASAELAATRHRIKARPSSNASGSPVIPEKTTYRPDSAALPGLYVVFSGITGEPLALLDGRALMRWRVAASSALAATYLARSDAARLLLVGAGTLMPYLADAHCAVRPIREILVWNRTPVHAEPLVKRLGAAERTASVTDDLEAAVRGADVICCATRAFEPLINGHWLPQGVHLDLIGSAPTHLEADRHAVRLCRVYLDDRSGLAANTSPQNMVALTDGEAATALVAEDIEGDLAGLARGIHGGRRRYDDRTMYVSTGSTFEDLAAAVHVLMRL